MYCSCLLDQRWIIWWQSCNSLDTIIQYIPPLRFFLSIPSYTADSVQYRRSSYTLCGIVCSSSSSSVLFSLPPPSCLASLQAPPPSCLHLVSLLPVSTDSVFLCSTLVLYLCHSLFVPVILPTSVAPCASFLSALCLALLISWKLSRHCSVPVGCVLAILCNTLMAPKGNLAHTHANTWTFRKTFYAYAITGIMHLTVIL